MKCGIYLITNLINNKKYVGQSLNIQKRWNQHRSAAFNPKNKSYNYPLYQAFRKYGIDNFSFEILEECNFADLNNKEEYYVKFYNTLSNQGYNQVLVGQAGTTLTPAIVLSIIEELQYNTSDNTETIGQHFGISGRTVRAINTGESWYNPDIQYPIRAQYINPKSKEGSTIHYCLLCGKALSTKSTYCVKCGHLVQRKVERPSREELKELIFTKPFTQIAKTYKVSDNTIRKWCVAYNLPSKKADISKLSKQEWELI